MTTVLDIRRTGADATSTSLALGGEATATSGSMVRGRRFPTSIPQGQLYYWSAFWQAGELAAERDLANGDVAEFADPADAIRWLLTNDD